MAGEKEGKKIALNDVMLTMDVVDTLRHQRSLVERELANEDHDRTLIDKVRRIYAEQGLDVSEEIIANAVAALREERFTYKPPPRGFKHVLARLYVNRGFWAKTVGMILAVFFVVWLGYQLLVSGPAERRAARQTKQLESSWEQLRQTDGIPSGIVSLGGRIHLNAQKDLKAGKDQKVDTAIGTLNRLVEIPGTIKNQLETFLKEVKENSAKNEAVDLAENALTALGQGDIKTAESHTNSLKSLTEKLLSEYDLLIVSRPGVSSGVWREPPNNRNAKNYYIIVEAVTPDGSKLTLPVTSEEDGKTEKVNMWGLRVDDRVYEQIRRDKVDDGIVNQNRFGAKQRGHLNPEFLYPTTGKAITKW